MTRGRQLHVSVFVYFVRLFFLSLLIQQSLSDETGDLRPCNETEGATHSGSASNHITRCRATMLGLAAGT
ncbi:unnamed protein product [Arctogadus glacialis]